MAIFKKALSSSNICIFSISDAHCIVHNDVNLDV